MTPGAGWYVPGGFLWTPTPPEREGKREVKMEMEGQGQERGKEASPEWNTWLRMSPDAWSRFIMISSPGRRKTKGKDRKDKDA